MIAYVAIAWKTRARARGEGSVATTVKRRHVRPRAVLTVALLVTIGVSVVVYRSWLDAQARAAGAIAVVAEVPALAWATRVITAEPRYEEELVAGVPTTVVRPGDGERWPALVFVNGATARGRHHPDVRRLASALARAGFLVLVPDLPGLARGEITPATAAATVSVARAATVRSDVREERVGLIGVSVGATLALLAAEDPALSDRVTVVSGLAPYTDLRNAIRIATTATTRDRGRVVPYRASSFLALVIARSLAAGLPQSRERAALLAELRRLPDDEPEPLAVFRGLGRAEGPAARALRALLANRNPARFDRLFAALPAGMRTGVERLSPIHSADRLLAPVELASASQDKYFPPSESRALVRAAPNARLTIAETLEHSELELSLDDLVGLVRVDGWIVRTLHAARAS
jgi:pimeloyl-ACP methyl ester carboxylesterase